MRSMRVYNRRVYRNTIAFGVALLAAGVALLVADIWFLSTASGTLRTLLGIVDFALFFVGVAYVITAFYGLAKARK